MDVKLLTLENQRGGKALAVRSNLATVSCPDLHIAEKKRARRTFAMFHPRNLALQLITVYRKGAVL